ncbi:DUF3108 domain-containing protein [Alcanivorax sp. JB21]|uniref:DUF3108 domain-containing protein n=1 Tax=Alcanivorax limicola TaxID=2874102 RepID=UPI001CBB679B|nr:DUF3108 domain-containing protein [Alcanivorax limicola]MBZ2188305.1 DUF3108 domain-containing protein [Alcanivorax limicola]
MAKYFPPRVINGIAVTLLSSALALTPASADSEQATDTRSGTPSPTPAAPIGAFSFTYGLSGSGVPFSIAADRTLEREGEDGWKMEIRARNILGSIRETTRFSWQDCTPQSTSYSYRRRGLGRTREANLDIDRDTNIAVAHRDGRDAQEFDIDDATTDILSQTLGLQCRLMRGERDDISIDVASERRRETMIYQATGEENVRVPAGRFDAVRVIRVRDDDSDRQTLLWFAPELDYALIKMVQDDGDGQYEMVLRSR